MNRYLKYKKKRDVRPHIEKLYGLGVAGWVGVVFLFWTLGVICGKLVTRLGILITGG